MELMRACPSRDSMRKKHYCSGVLLLFATILSSIQLWAASFTWQLATSGQAGRWNNAGSWTGAGGPPAASDTAIFSSGGTAAVQVRNNTSVAGIIFNGSAQAYSF